MKINYDIVIVGAGPVGSTLASKLLTLNNHNKVCIIEEHKKPGSPQQCSGLFSKNIKNILPLEKKEIIQEIKGADFYSPSKIHLEIKTKETQAYVVDRTLFDFRLAKEAEKKGAKIMSQTIFLGAKKYKNLYKIKIHDKKQNKTKIIISKYIVGCDGAGSVVAKTFCFPKMKCLYGYITFSKVKAMKDNKFIKSNKVALYLGKKIAPDFFLWKIPRAKENIIETGTASYQNPVKFIKKFKKEENNNSRVFSTTAGLIPFEIRKQILKDGVMLIGDAAGQVKATTGGGVIWGIKCTDYASIALNRAIKENNDKYLKNYINAFDKKAKLELKLLKLVRTFMNSRLDRQTDSLFKILNNKKIIKFIEENGDMDSITPIFISLFKKPQLWPYVAKSIICLLI